MPDHSEELNADVKLCILFILSTHVALNQHGPICQPSIIYSWLNQYVFQCATVKWFKGSE